MSARDVIWQRARLVIRVLERSFRQSPHLLIHRAVRIDGTRKEKMQAGRRFADDKAGAANRPMVALT
jgi:hypothetical protein